jgi:hypothetical protein
MKPKALPPAKINPTKLLGGSGGSLTTTIKKISSKSILDDRNFLGISIIKKQVIHINNLVKTNTLLKVKEEERKRKLSEQKRFGEKEQKLEEPKGKENKIPSLPGLPKLGFLERIKNFLFNVFLGYISLRLLPYLPKLAGVVDTIIKVQDTIIDISGKILNGLVSFVDKAYEVHDKTRKFIGNLGGDGFTKTFDGFIGAMDKVIEASIIAAIAFGELRDTGGGVGGGPGGRRGGFSGSGRTYSGGRQRGFIGNQGSTLAEQRVLSGGSRGFYFENSNRDIMKRYFQKYGRQAAIERFGEEGVRSLGGRYARSGITNLARRGLVGALGRGGTKTALRIVRPLVKNLPLIGGIMEFVLSWMSGDPVGKAAFRGVGAGLGTWVGGAIGSLIPIPGVGTAIGMWLGSEGGSALGGLLYDKIFNNKDPKEQKIEGRAQGGPITRGGRLSGPAKRIVQKPKPKRTLKVQVTEVKPGQSVGGKENIKKVFPEAETKERGKTVNPLGYMKSSYKTASSIPGLGGLATIFIKGQMGEKPSSTDYQNAASGLSAWMQTIYGTGIQRTGAAFAEGGKVDVSMFSDDIVIKNALSKAIQDTVSPKVDEMINDLRKQVGLKSITATRILENAPPEQLQPEGEYDLGEGAGGSPELRREVAKAAAELGVPAPDLLGCILAESGGISSRTNQFGCTGLIQFCPDVSGGSYKTIGGRRVSLSSLRSMSIAQQMPYVVQYLKDAGVKPGMNGYDIYSAIHAGSPGGNVVDANGVSTRGFFASNVEPLIRRARENSRLTAGSGGGSASSLAEAAKMMKGFSSASGPEGGNLACVWAVNQVYKKAGIRPPWGSSNYVPDAESAMVRSGYQRIRSGQQRPGDVYIAPGQSHIGIVLPNGNIISNSSSGAKFSWEASLSDYNNYYGGSGTFYRMPVSRGNNRRPSGTTVFVGDSIARGLSGNPGRGSNADLQQWGRSSSDVLSVIRANKDSLKNKNVILSSGILNSPSDERSVSSQLQHLKDIGAGVKLVGAPTNNRRYSYLNDKLRSIASRYNTTFLGGYSAGSDGLHPNSYSGLYRFSKGGKVHGFTRAIIGERGPEFVIDADSTRALEENYPGFLNALNKANYNDAIKVLRSYAEYEQGATIRAMVNEKMIPVPIPVASPQQSFVVISSFGESDDYMSSSYKG